MKSLKGISSFVSVASSGSFAAAAKLLGVSAVAVSKNVATLERQLGVRLFQRTTRKTSLTQEGEAFYEQCQGPLRELEAAEAKAANSTQAPVGMVRVTCMPPIATGFLLPMLDRFHAQYPKVSIELHLASNVSDMVSEGFDVGIRVGPMRDSSYIARAIAPLPFVVCASPGYWSKYTKPKTLEELTSHNCIRIARAGGQSPMSWMLQGMSEAIASQLKSTLSVNDFAAAVHAAVAGYGIVCAPLPLVMPLFRSGQLRPVLTEHIAARLQVYLYYLNRKNLPNRTRVFVDFVLEQLRQEKDLQTPPDVLVAPFII